MRRPDGPEAGLHGFELLSRMSELLIPASATRDALPIMGVETEGAADDLAVPSQVTSKPSEP